MPPPPAAWPSRGFTVALIDLPLEPEGRVAELPGPYQPAHSSDLDVAAAACEGRGEAHAADVRDVDALGRVIDAVVDRHGRIDVVVAAAGADRRRASRPGRPPTRSGRP